MKLTKHVLLFAVALTASIASSTSAQSVCLPAPRLLTTMPMGGQAGMSVDVTITGDNLDDIDSLNFSHSGITATPKLANGKPVPNQFVVSIAKDCPTGVHEARVMTRLGVSSSRAFNVGALSEVTRTKANTSLATAMPLAVDSVCNATMTAKAIDYYSFQATKGQRVVIDCVAKGIDSKLKPVLIVADADGADLKVERRGGAIDFTASEAGKYIVKVNDLTYNGGPYHFYRLAVQSVEAGKAVPRLPSTQTVSSFSWPPVGLKDDAMLAEVEPNNKHAEAQKITLPCDISGRFYPAADVDTFEFTAKKGEVWWVEVASERLGRPTDPAVVVQKVEADGKLTDIAEMNDIPSPVKVSSNGYSYDGPPYNAGSTDVNGRFTAKEDGTYRLQIRDLFGGTRTDPRNIYRMIVRKSSPDFALVGWALHMNLRNGDRNALSKPISLRGGSTMAIEVVRVGRDGCAEEVELFMKGLPEGVTATGVKIPSGQTRGIMLVTAAPNAPRSLASASLYGRSTISGKVVTRPCRLASMAWPVPNAWSEIPSPRLLADVPVSVSGSELAPITIAAKEQKVWEANVGQKLTIPLAHTRRSEFSGQTINLRNWNSGVGSVAAFDASLKANGSKAVIDLAKTQPGEYVIAFYGSAVAKYRYHPEAIEIAGLFLKKAKQEATAQADNAKKLAAAAKKASAESKAQADRTAQDAADKQKVAEAAVAAAEKRLKDVTAKAQPRDIVDIVVSTPIKIRVKPAAK